LILSKIIKIVATNCQILRIKCTKFDFGWASAPDPMHWGSSQRSPDHLAVFKGPTSKGRDGRDRRWREGKRGEGERGQGEDRAEEEGKRKGMEEDERGGKGQKGEKEI